MSRILGNLRRLTEIVAGKSVFESRLYRESELTRLVNLFAHVDLDRWRGLKVLEVGAGFGRFGDAFAHLGFDVTSTDGRPEHVERMRERGREAFVLDLDESGVDGVGDFDLILAFGVLYHLSQPRRFLQSCAGAARILLLESCVSDTAEPVAPRMRESRGMGGADQALNRFGCRPSPAWVEEVCHESGFKNVRDISSPLANWSTARFDWLPLGDGAWRRDGVSLRKMWIAEKAS